jgi:DNA-binding NtrC family response regulator
LRGAHFFAGGRTGIPAYPWPGNVRELRHVVERACIFSMMATLEPDAFFELSGGPPADAHGRGY